MDVLPPSEPLYALTATSFRKPTSEASTALRTQGPRRGSTKVVPCKASPSAPGIAPEVTAGKDDDGGVRPATSVPPVHCSPSGNKGTKFVWHGRQHDSVPGGWHMPKTHAWTDLLPDMHLLVHTGPWICGRWTTSARAQPLTLLCPAVLRSLPGTGSSRSLTNSQRQENKSNHPGSAKDLGATPADGGSDKGRPAVPVVLLARSAVQQSRGVPWQLFRQVRGVFMEMVRRHHVVFSIFLAQGDAQLPLNLTQRILVGNVGVARLEARTACKYPPLVIVQFVGGSLKPSHPR
jgi:hypothetical protein